MQLRIYNEGADKKMCTLRLMRPPKGTDDIIVVAVDSNGEHKISGAILRIRANGTIVRCKNVADDIGFELDSSGSVVINTEGE